MSCLFMNSNHGNRLLASSLLPISGKSTLIYGSTDGGKTIANKSVEMESKIKMVAKMLNLAGEYVWNNQMTKREFLYLSSDIEGHLGKDGRFYLVDTARLFPPTVPRPGIKGDFLKSQMRPELVKSNPIPLCPDSFSGFRLENKLDHNREIIDATNRLLNQIIPDFAERIESYLAVEILHSDNEMESTLEEILIQMHRQGINFKYLGYIRDHLRNEILRSLFLTEAFARTIKNDIRYKMRQLKGREAMEEYSYINVVLDELNLIFGSNMDSQRYWECELLPSVATRFQNCIKDGEDEELVQFENRWRGERHGYLYGKLLLSRIRKMLGLVFNDAFVIKEEFPTAGTIFQATDIISMNPIIKQFHRIFFEEATALSRLAVILGSTSSQEGRNNSKKTYQLAETKFKQAILANPSDYRSLSNWGLCLFMQGMQEKEKEMKQNGFLSDQSISEIENLWKMAEQKFREAIAIHGDDHVTLNKLGNCLFERAKLIGGDISSQLLEQAFNYYQKASEIYPEGYSILYNWGNALLHKWKLCTNISERSHAISLAIEKYQLAHQLNTKSHRVLKSLAVAWCKQVRYDYEIIFLIRLWKVRLVSKEEMEVVFKKALLALQNASELVPNDYETFFIWGSALYQQARKKLQIGCDLKVIKTILYEASDKYFQSLKLNPSHLSGLNSWTKMLIQLISLEDSSSNRLNHTMRGYLSIFSIISARGDKNSVN
jgi:tetratricopeptide (TPR) repeat protein